MLGLYSGQYQRPNAIPKKANNNRKQPTAIDFFSIQSREVSAVEKDVFHEEESNGGRKFYLNIEKNACGEISEQVISIPIVLSTWTECLLQGIIAFLCPNWDLFIPNRLALEKETDRKGIGILV